MTSVLTITLENRWQGMACRTADIGICKHGMACITLLLILLLITRSTSKPG